MDIKARIRSAKCNLKFNASIIKTAATEAAETVGGYVKQLKNRMPIKCADGKTRYYAHISDVFVCSALGSMVACTAPIRGIDRLHLVITDMWFEDLSEETKQFLFSHELGHIYWNHIRPKQRKAAKLLHAGVTRTDINAQLRDEVEEYQADEYAAKIVGAPMAISALFELKGFLEEIGPENLTSGQDGIDELDRRIDNIRRKASLGLLPIAVAS